MWSHCLHRSISWSITILLQTTHYVPFHSSQYHPCPFHSLHRGSIYNNNIEVLYFFSLHSSYLCFYIIISLSIILPSCFLQSISVSLFFYQSIYFFSSIYLSIFLLCSSAPNLSFPTFFVHSNFDLFFFRFFFPSRDFLSGNWPRVKVPRKIIRTKLFPKLLNHGSTIGKTNTLALMMYYVCLDSLSRRAFKNLANGCYVASAIPNYSTSCYRHQLEQNQLYRLRWPIVSPALVWYQLHQHLL